MTRALHIAKGLNLPLELVTETFAILAKRRMGKSYTARRIVEQLFAAALQVVIVDPKGDWWGIRSAADGKGPGLSILILGGEHGDVPLEPGSGELVAKLIVEQRVSVLLDLSLFRKSEVARFMTDLAESLYRLKAREEFRSAMMLLLDEADAVAPQKPQHGEERMLGAIEDIVRRGGQRGIGCGLITQRSAVLNKNVLTQVQLLIALRTIAPQDLKAMDAWIDVHGTIAQRKELMESLPSLPRGDAWFWSPGWPTDDGIFQRVHVLPIETFDSGATPKAGEKRVEPKHRADVDVEVLRKQMAATIERQKADDPRELKKQLAEARAEIKKLQAAKVPVAKVETKEVYVLKEGQLKRLEVLKDYFEKNAERYEGLGRELRAAAADLAKALSPALQPQPSKMPPSVFTPRPMREPGTYNVPPRPTVQRPPPPAPPAQDAGELTDYALLLLRTLAERQPMKLTAGQLAALSNRSARSSSFEAALALLKRLGMAASEGDRVVLTETGAAQVGAATPKPTTPDELREAYLGVLPGYERELLRVLLDVYPATITREEIGQRANKSHTSSTFEAAMASLKRNGLVEGKSGEERASPKLLA